VLIDLEQRRVIRNAEQQTKCGWSPWDGAEVRGIPIRTWVRGETVYRNENGVEWFAQQACGAEALFDPQLGGYWAQRRAAR
jgi:dihydroorotase